MTAMKQIGSFCFVLAIWSRVTQGQDATITFDGYRLQRFDIAKAYSEIEELCATQGGWTVEPRYQEFNDALVTLLSGKDDYFIGLRKWGNNDWRWLNYDKATFTDWNGNEGSDAGSSGETCAKLNGNGKWYSVNCMGQARKYICQSLMPPVKVSTFNGFLFERFDVLWTASMAERACLNRGAWLVQIKDVATDGQVADLISDGDYFYYIGLKYTDEWRWRDGMKLEETKYSNWKPGEGGATGGHICSVVEAADIKWTDLPCSRERHFICQSLRKPNKEVFHLNYLLERFDETVTDIEAAERCKARGAWLVEPKNEALNDAVKILIGSGGAYFIGLKYSAGNNWRWSDGTVAGFTDWRENEGKNPNENCAVMKDIGWADVYCRGDKSNSDPKNYVCQSGPNNTVHSGEFVLDRFDLPVSDNYAAQSRCMARNGHLVFTEENTINDFVKNNVVEDAVDYHIGLSQTEATWKWHDGRGLSGFKDWGDSPDDFNCTSINKDNWKVNYCGKSNRYFCQSGAYCKSPFYSNACKNGGVCNSDPITPPYYTCDCTGTGYYGSTCNAEYCNAHGNPCQNGGKCKSNPSESPYYTCDCAGTGYYGLTCTVEYCNLNDHKDTCKNGGKCESKPNDSPYYTCDCTGTGYYGLTCSDREFFEKGTCKYHINYNTLERGSFDAVSETCSSISGVLTMDKDLQTHDFLVQSIVDYYGTSTTFFWIGGQNPSIWTWLDTSPIAITDDDGFSKWKSGEPDNTGKCMRMSNNGNDNFEWSDETCNSNHGWICESPVSGQEPCNSNGPCRNGSCIPTGCQWRCQCYAGFFNITCDSDLITITSTPSVTAISGEDIDIEVNVFSYEPEATVEMYKDGSFTNVSQSVNSSGSMIFTLTAIVEEDEGYYTFSAFPPDRSYSRSTTTELTVHVRANISSDASFIFSPPTNGPSSVACDSYGIPTPTCEWYRNDKLVLTSNGGGVYQTNSSELHTCSSVLDVGDASLTEQGNYTCKTKNIVGEKEEEESILKTSTTFLAVYGPPEILSIKATECSEEGEITIKWQPNSQTTDIFHRFSVKGLNEPETTESSEKVKYKEDEPVSFSSLLPCTVYEILVEVCPDDCISKLKDAEQQETGVGLPGNVTNVEIDDKTDGVCSVSWTLPNDPTSCNITGFEIDWEYPLDEETPGYETETSDSSTSVNVASSERTHSIETRPNRVYMAFVRAKTCAGDGHFIRDPARQCTTPPKEPDAIPSSNITESSARSSTRSITINIASQVNGRISCTFVILSKGKELPENPNVTLDQLREFQSRAESGNDLDKGYLTLSIPTRDVNGATYEAILGNKNTTSCNVTDTGNGEPNRKRRRKREVSDEFSAKNVELDINGETYWYATITTTPCAADTICVKQSGVKSFINGKSIVGVVIGGVLGVVLGIAVIVIVIWLYRRNRGKSNPPDPTFDLPPRSGIVHDHKPPANESLYENVMSGLITRIALADLEREYVRMKADESMLFREQYQNLKAAAKRQAPSSTYGVTDAAMAKNRYKNIIPYDTSRVKLQGHGYDYINACYIKKGSELQKYIAAQGPLPNTVHDFWSMVLQQKCKIIVMLTKCLEAGKTKCEKYWPDRHQQSLQFESITVQNLEELSRGGYIRRKLIIHSHQTGGEETVYQYHFLRWPDHGVPATTSSFFRLYKDVMNDQKISRSNAPILVHCSAGVGRTGTFIGYDILLEDMKKEKIVDVYGRVLGMRKDRVDMVQTGDQYELLYKLLLETHLFGDTDVDESRIAQKSKSAIGHEFKNLTQSDSLNFRKDDPGNGVVIIRQPEDTEWIQMDATYVEAYQQSTRLIVTKAPKHSTVEYFWRAISDNDIDLVVMLNRLENNAADTQNQLAHYWPHSKDIPLTLNSISVEMLSESQSRGTTYRKLRMARKNKPPKDVRHYQYLGWPLNSSPQDPGEILELINNLRQEGSAASILVHCSDDLGRSGAFCAIFNLVERILVERKIDTFRAVKDIRDIRSGMLLSEDQYKFCFEAAKAHLNVASTYENMGFQAGDDPIYQNWQSS